MKMKTKIFSIAGSITGQYNASVQFTDDKEKEEWLKTDFKRLQQKYKVQVSFYKLPGLKVGDRCFVAGEGDDEFVITGLKQHKGYSHCFIVTHLDSGHEWSEEVSKCYK